MRIGVVYHQALANAQYRAVMPAEALARKGHDIAFVPQSADGVLDAGRLWDRDLVHIYRSADDTILKLVPELRRRGVAVTWDNDDDIRLIPKTSPQWAHWTRSGVERHHRQMMKLARQVDAVTATSDYLVERYREAGQSDVRLIENFLGPQQLSRSSRRHDGFVIGWMASGEHYADDKALGITRTLQSVMDRHPAVRVVTIGVHLHLDGERYTHHPMVDFERLKDHYRRWDLAIAPLADIPMSYARSNVKVKEYAGAGTPWLASARGPYTGLGPGQGGVLVVDDGWQQELEELIGSGRRRWALRRKSQAWGKSQCIDRHVGLWERVFEDAVAAVARPAAATG